MVRPGTGPGVRPGTGTGMVLGIRVVGIASVCQSEVVIGCVAEISRHS